MCSASSQSARASLIIQPTQNNYRRCLHSEDMSLVKENWRLFIFYKTLLFHAQGLLLIIIEPWIQITHAMAHLTQHTPMYSISRLFIQIKNLISSEYLSLFILNHAWHRLFHWTILCVVTSFLAWFLKIASSRLWQLLMNSTKHTIWLVILFHTLLAWVKRKVLCVMKYIFSSYPFAQTQ